MVVQFRKEPGEDMPQMGLVTQVQLQDVARLPARIVDLPVHMGGRAGFRWL